MFLQMHSNFFGTKAVPIASGEFFSKEDLENIFFCLNGKLMNAWQYLWGYPLSNPGYGWEIVEFTEFEVLPRVYPEKVYQTAMEILKTRGVRKRVMTLSNGGLFIPHDWPPLEGTYVSPQGETTYMTSLFFYTEDGLREITSTPLADLADAGIYPGDFLE